MKKNRVIFYLMFLFEGMVFYTSISTLYRQAAGLSIFQITIIESLSLALSLVLEMPWGVIADRIGYKHTLIMSSFVYFISKIVFWKAGDFMGFLLERILLSIALAGMSGCDMGMLYLSCEEDESQKAFGICNNMQMLGMLFASVTYSVFLSSQPYRMSALLTIVSYGVVLILSFGLTEIKKDQAEKDLQKKSAQKNKQEVKGVEHEQAAEEKGSKFFKEKLLETMRNKKLLGFLIGAALLSETHQTVTVFLSQLQYTACGISEKYFGYLLILVTLAGMVGGVSSECTKWVGRRRLTRILYGMAIAACIILGWTRNPYISVIAVLLLRVALSLFAPLELQVQNEAILVEDRATMLSINAVLMESTGVVTNMLFGKVAELSLASAMFLGAALCLLGIILVNKMIR